MRICLIGRTGFLLEAGRRLQAQGHAIVAVITAKETPESTATAGDYEAFARACSVPFFRTADASRPDVLAALATAAPDLAVTMNYPGMLTEAFIRLFPRGVFNCHGSLLPLYRGNACPNWAVLNGDAETGLTIHRIDDERLDCGPILLQKRFSLAAGEDISDVYRWYERAVPEAFVEAVGGLAAGTLTPTPQDDARASYAFPRRPEDGRLDFAKTPAECVNLVRAATRPFPGAFCSLEGRTRVVVWRARVIDCQGLIHAAPGQVLAFDGLRSIDVAAGRGAIRFLDFGADGKLVLTRKSRFV
jgi:UDP-4-amino-4-deoxy-L-arabinose formyltransferase/UDP-glucuronic acid dehydrogenase (UDP-4-keto-hexauronic acid decarboxylating)